MPEAKIPPTERIVSSYKQLAIETNDCNAAFTETHWNNDSSEKSVGEFRFGQLAK